MQTPSLRHLLSLFLFKLLIVILLLSSCHPKATQTQTTSTTDPACIDPAKIDPDVACMALYDPVCGCDEKTYSNACYAAAAGLKKWQPGTCATDETAERDDCIDQNKINPKAACNRMYRPVCGCDNITYSNECEAEKAGLRKWTAGACAEKNSDCIDPAAINRDAICAEIYQPVCGCDGNTYGNSCEATAAGLKDWKEGACCIDQSKVQLNRPCTKEYRPVCGCDGKTYSNPCLAENAGVIEWEKGPCGVD